VQILDIDRENRKLSLGHKHVEENPWDTFETVFPVGSYHEATVMKRDDKGAIVQLPYGLEAFAPARHLRKENGKLAEVDETLTFKVIEFNRDDKRIMVSHLRYLEDIQREAEDVVKEERKKQGAETQKVIKEQQAKYEPTTLGDMAMFSQLKEQLAEAKTRPVKEEAPAVEEKTETPAQEVTTEKVTAAVAEPTAKPAKVKAEGGDDLKIIEGIGPKIAEILGAAGIHTFAELAEKDPDAIREILAEQGSRYKAHDPATWPKQAKLAAEGKMDELQELKDALHAGKE
jgi:ribosomal protein S1